MKNKFSYTSVAILGIMLLAFSGVFVRISSLSPVATGFYRVLFAIIIMYPFVRKDLKNINKKDIKLLLISGVFLGLDLIAWNISFTMTSIANANLLANMVPFTLIPVSYFIYKERFSKKYWFGLFLTIIGLILLINGKATPSQQNFVGDFLALLTSVFYAIFILINASVAKKNNALTVMFICSFGALLALFIGMMTLEGFSYPNSIESLLPILGLAIFAQILGQTMMSYASSNLQLSIVSIIVLLQPVFAAFYAWLIFKEALSIQEIVAILIVLLGIYIAKSSIIKKDHITTFYELYPQYNNATNNKFSWNEELLNLTLLGKKTMTSSLHKEYISENETLPEVGLISFVYDEFDKLKCVLKIINVEYHKFNQVPEYVAYKEGEGDQSLGYYLDVHHDLFKGIDRTFNDEDMIVVEEFEVIHVF